MGQSLDHRLEEFGVEFDRAQPQGIGDAAQAPVIEEQPLRNCFPMKFSRRFEISRVQWLAEQRRSSE